VANIIGEFLRDETGATAVEYGLIAGILSIGIAGFVQPLSDAIVLMYTLAADAVTNASSTIP
jgi:pilus assembly protein Flp/PilA